MVCDTPNGTMSSIRSVSKGKIIFFSRRTVSQIISPWEHLLHGVIVLEVCIATPSVKCKWPWLSLALTEEPVI